MTIRNKLVWISPSKILLFLSASLLATQHIVPNLPVEESKGPRPPKDSIQSVDAGFPQNRDNPVRVMNGQLKSPSPAVLLLKIAQYVEDHPEVKPLARAALHPVSTTSPLYFDGQKNLTKPLLDAYLDRAVVHMNRWDERSMQFFKYSGAKFNHWGDLGWARLYSEDDWRAITQAADTIHNSDWGRDMILECGIMEAVSESQTDNQRLPDWYLKALEDLGIQQHRLPGPKGLQYFNYEAMFDRNAKDWPAQNIELWGKGCSVPDITMVETLLYYAWCTAEYLDAGFEGIMWGQIMLTGARDVDNNAVHGLCEFARSWAAKRGYRHAVSLTSHINRPLDYPKENGTPIFTHITWPTRLSYTSLTPFGMHFGAGVKATSARQGGEEIEGLLQLPHDLPILLEIDNYGRSFGPSTVCEEGWDEITAFAKKPAADRRAFLEYYYYEMRNWLNCDGKNRIHLAMPGIRSLNEPTSLGFDKHGIPLPAVNEYAPFAETGGDEATIKQLFEKAYNP